MKTLLSLLLLLCLGISPVFACSPTSTPPDFVPPPPPTVEELSRSVPVIFVGTVLREVESPDYFRRFEIQVERYLKGSGFDIVIISGYGYGTDCLPMLYEGNEHVFMVNEYGNSFGIPVYSRFVDFSIQMENRVISATSQSLAPQPLPLDIQLSRLAEEGSFNWLYIPLVILGLFLCLLIVWFWRRSQRGKRKAKREENLR